MSARRRVSVGFEGGQVLTARVSDEALAVIRGAVEQGGWHNVDTEDGSAYVNADKIVYVLTDAGDQRVGFGLS
jgi:hypothetical protein